MVSVLLIEDDALMAESLAFLLRQEGHSVEVAGTGHLALERMRREPVDLVLLDVALPDLSGVEVCRRLRAFWAGPIIMLTARRQEIDKIIALDAGADDYVTKPFAQGELLARIRAAARRTAALSSQGAVEQGEPIVVGALRIEPNAHRVFVASKEVSFAAREFDLLLLLARQAGRVVARRILFDSVWGPDFYGDERALDVYMRELRKKIEPEPSRPVYLHTVRGVGFRLAHEPEPRAPD
ncbi:MAG: response regulator transcription factor [Chloroflexi bacterium]|nr:response regulator transcription factor [Chloroflexota bacterium]